MVEIDVEVEISARLMTKIDEESCVLAEWPWNPCAARSPLNKHGSGLFKLSSPKVMIAFAAREPSLKRAM